MTSGISQPAEAISSETDREWRSIPSARAPSERQRRSSNSSTSVEPPPWMDALIVQLAPWRVSFSKYAAAMSESAPAEIC